MMQNCGEMDIRIEADRIYLFVIYFLLFLFASVAALIHL